MSIPMFLALTSEDFSKTAPIPRKTAWMSLNFSRNSTGLSNFPQQLPPRSLIILDDHIPWDHHEAEQICKDLTMTLQKNEASGLLLDFERAPTEEMIQLTKEIANCCKELNVPLGAPANYLVADNMALFISPFPCCILADSIMPHRKIWVDLSPVCHRIRLSKDSAEGSLEVYPPQNITMKHRIYWDDDFLCNYFTEADGDTIRISLFRDAKCALHLLKRINPAQIQLAIGLWKDFAKFYHSDL